jgi:hypothetical protein
MDSLNKVHGKVKSAMTAKGNWDKELEEKRKVKVYEEEQKQQAMSRREKDARDAIAVKAREDFDYKVTGGIFDDAHVKSKFDETNTEIQEMNEGKRAKLQYDGTVTIFAKGKLFDDLVTKYRELEEKYKKEFEKKRAGLGAGSVERKDAAPPDEGDRYKPNDSADYDPTGFLR